MLHVNRLHVIFSLHVAPVDGVHHLIDLKRDTHVIFAVFEPSFAFLVATPDSHASLVVTLASRRPDVDDVPLTLVHDPARLFSRLFFGTFSKK